MKKLTLLLMVAAMCTVGQAYDPSKKITPEKQDHPAKKLAAYEQLILQYKNSNPDTVLKLAAEEVALAHAHSVKDFEGKGFLNLSTAYIFKSDYANALKSALGALELFQSINDRKSIAVCYRLIGLIDYYKSYYNEALQYYNKAVLINRELNNKYELASCFNNIGIIFQAENKIDSAVNYYQQALAIYESLNDRESVGTIYLNLGNIFHTKKQFEKALDYYFSSLKIRKLLNDKQGLGNCYLNIGESYILRMQYLPAENYLDSASKMALEIGNTNLLRYVYSAKADLYDKKGDHKQAFDFQKKYMQLSDSIFNAESINQLNELKTKFELDVKEREVRAKAEAEKEKEHAINAEKAKRQQMILFCIITLLIIAAIFSYFLYKRFITIRSQKALIEIKNTEILDSIKYARRVQSAILPKVELFNDHFGDSFVLYLPKDIVAGDFYWLEHIDGITFIAAADSTGHGVPGALVSVVCNNALNRSLKELGLRETGAILDKTRELILEAFSKSGENINDGMDISLARIEMAGQKAKIQWSGANNPLWIFKKQGEFVEIKADKQPVGLSYNPSPFASHSFELEAGDVFYLLTDGFADQFGGDRGKKYKYKKLQAFLSSVRLDSLALQKEGLRAEFLRYKGLQEQVDDVTVIGIRL